MSIIGKLVIYRKVTKVIVSLPTKTALYALEKEFYQKELEGLIGRRLYSIIKPTVYSNAYSTRYSTMYSTIYSIIWFIVLS